MLLCIYPFYYILINSLSSPEAISRGVYFFPFHFDISTYGQMLQLKGFANAFMISVARTVLGTLLTVFSCAFLSYLLTKQEMFLRKAVYRLIIITMYLNAGLIPWYITMKNLGLKDNFLVYILPSVVVAFYVILLKTFMEQIPGSLEESAEIDGAGYMAIFTRIIFPVSMPIVATVIVFHSVNQWNSWTDNYFLVPSEKLQTLQLILLNYLRESESLASQANLNMQSSSFGNSVRVSSQSVKMAITMIVTFPILLVYPFLQKYFVKGIMLGAIKG
jgi:putative aldouronate transport system permease protein